MGMSTSFNPTFPALAGQGTPNADALVQAAATAPPQMKTRLYQQAAYRGLEEGDTEKARQIANDHLQNNARDAVMQRIAMREMTKKAEGARLEEVRQASRGPVWFQLYQVGGRAAAEDAIGRARAAGYSALVVTIDTPVAGMRERDARNGTSQLLGGSLLAKLPYLPQLLLKPGWLARFLLDGGVPRLPNVNVPGQGPMRLMDVNAALSGTALTWDDFRWIRELWPGPLVVKGVLNAEDACRAVDVGAAAVVVSNHGGRQLDGAPATLRVLPEIAAAVGHRAEVLLDGGVRRGSDIVKAICLGARAVLVGRAYAYGLAALGEAGVARALGILKADMARTLPLIGCSSVAALGREYLETTDPGNGR